jgi:hypothetical protein
MHLTALAFQPQVAVWIRSQRMSAASLVQCTIHKNLHFNNSATRGHSQEQEQAQASDFCKGILALLNVILVLKTAGCEALTCPHCLPSHHAL